MHSHTLARPTARMVLIALAVPVLTVVVHSVATSRGASVAAAWLVAIVASAGAGVVAMRSLAPVPPSQPDPVLAQDPSETSEDDLLPPDWPTPLAFTLDEAGRFTRVSGDSCPSLGWQKRELLDTTLAALIHPDDAPGPRGRGWLDSDGSVLDPEDSVIRIRSASGDYTWMTLRLQATTDAAGTRRVVGSLAEADALVRAYGRHKQRADMLSQAADAMIDPEVVLRAVRDGRGRVIDFTVLQVNKATCTALLRARSDLIGQTLTSALPHLAGLEVFRLLALTAEFGGPVSLDAHRVIPAGGATPQFFDIRAGQAPEDHVAVSWRETTAQQTTLRRLAESEKRFRLLAEHSSDVVLYSTGGVISWVSPALTRELGWEPADWIGFRIDAFTDPADLNVVRDRLQRDVKKGRQVLTRLRLLDKAGDPHWVEMHAEMVPSSERGEEGCVGAFRVIDDIVAREREREARVDYDDLTSALTRSRTLHHLDRLPEESRRRGQLTAVLLADIDDLGRVNDSVGRAAGDTVLRTTVERIRGCLRTTDVIGRVGDDEFVVVLEGLTHNLDATRLAGEVQLACSVPVVTDHGSVTVSVSIGVAFLAPGDTAETLVQRAESAMHSARQSGRRAAVKVADSPESDLVASAAESAL